MTHTTADALREEELLASVRKMNQEADKLYWERQKLMMEQDKLVSEQVKLVEERHLMKKNKWFEFSLMLGLVAATVAITKLFL